MGLHSYPQVWIVFSPLNNTLPRKREYKCPSVARRFREFLQDLCFVHFTKTNFSIVPGFCDSLFYFLSRLCLYLSLWVFFFFFLSLLLPSVPKSLINQDSPSTLSPCSLKSGLEPQVSCLQKIRVHSNSRTAFIF